MPASTPTALFSARNLRLLSSLLSPAVRISASQPSQSSNRSQCLPKPMHTSALQYSTPAHHEPSNATAQSSVSPTETLHFSRLASTWWDPHGPSRLLHLMNPLRHTFIASCLSSRARAPDREELRYLDVGCGGGIFAESAARLTHTFAVTGIDPTPSVIQVARSHQRTDPALLLHDHHSRPPKLTYLNTAVEDLAIPTAEAEKADILTLFEVLEHIDRPAAFLESCIPHVKSGGWIVGSTIARSALSYLTTKVVAEAPLLGLVPRGTHDWGKYINPNELRGWFEKRNNKAGSDPSVERWGKLTSQGLIYLPGLGWRMVDGAEAFGNYFFGVQKLEN